jgi:hypothetical protein
MAVAQRSAALRVTFFCARDYHGSKATSVLLPILPNDPRRLGRASGPPRANAALTIPREWPHASRLRSAHLRLARSR